MKLLVCLFAISASILMEACGNNSGTSTGNAENTAKPADSAAISGLSSGAANPGDTNPAENKVNGTRPGTDAPAGNGSTDIKGIVWKELEKLPLAADPLKEESIGVATIQPGTPAERHSHAENEIGYVLEGESILEVDGQPSRTIRAGDSFAIPAGKVHRARPGGSVPFKVVVTYIVPKGQPLADPAE